MTPTEEVFGADAGDSAEPQEPVVVTDKRRVDPETGDVRPQASGPAASGPAPEAPPAEAADALAELTADLQRVQADFSNYRRRALRDQQVLAERAKASVVSQLLGVLDDLDRARSHGDLETGPLRAVADKITSTLQGLGLAAFGEEGEEFDPELHEAVQHDGDGSNPVVGTLLRRGYRMGEQILRHAMVAVVDTVTEPGDQPDADGIGHEPATDDAQSDGEPA